MKSPKWAFTVVFFWLSPLGCSGGSAEGDVGAVCTADEHCVDGLTCDVHGADDGTGTCQVPHEH